MEWEVHSGCLELIYSYLSSCHGELHLLLLLPRCCHYSVFTRDAEPQLVTLLLSYFCWVYEHHWLQMISTKLFKGDHRVHGYHQTVVCLCFSDVLGSVVSCYLYITFGFCLSHFCVCSCAAHVLPPANKPV